MRVAEEASKRERKRELSDRIDSAFWTTAPTPAYVQPGSGTLTTGGTWPATGITWTTAATANQAVYTSAADIPR